MLPELPVEVLARVLCLLPCGEHARLAAVCRRLRALVGSGATWTRVELLPPPAPALPPHDVWGALLRRAGGALRRLDVSGVCDDGDSVVAVVRDTLSDAQRRALTHLRCTGLPPDAALSAQQVTALLAACPALRSLRVDARCTVASDDALTSLIQPPGRPVALRVARLYVDDAPRLEGARRVRDGACTDQLRLLCGSCEELSSLSVIEADVDIHALLAAMPPTGAGPRLSVTAVAWDNNGGWADRVAALPRLSALRVVDVEDDMSFDALSAALAMRTSPLRALSVQHSTLGSLGVVAELAAALRASRSCLRRFELQHTVFYDDSHDVQLITQARFNSGTRQRPRSACTLLLNALADCECLEELSLAGSQFGEQDAAAIALLLRASASLRSLDVSGCVLHCAGVTALADALASPTASLTRLCVGSVGADAKGAQALARMLAVNTRLRELHAGAPSEFDAELSWRACDSAVLLAALPRASPALRLLTLTLPRGNEDYASDNEGELGHGPQLLQLKIKALRREHPQCAEVQLTDELRRFDI
jgi:hypothetical protein